MSLNMAGHIDAVFKSVTATRTVKTPGAYGSDGIWVPGSTTDSTHVINLQPLNELEIKNLEIGSERIEDHRKIYVNDGADYSLQYDTWTFPAEAGAPDGVYKVIRLDKRPTRTYAKIIVSRIDDSG